MRKPELNLSITPPGQFTFREKSDFIVKDTSYPRLFEAIARFRKNNKFLYPDGIGDVVADVTKQICSERPEGCIGTDWHSKNPNEKRAKLYARASEWLSGMSSRAPRGGYSLAPDEEANRRARICSGCPFNMDEQEQKCGSCLGSFKELIQKLRNKKETGLDSKLFVCTKTGQACATAVWIRKADLGLGPSQKAALPNFCWQHE